MSEQSVPPWKQTRRKAHSVNEDGTPDGYNPPSAFTDRVLPGMTRLGVFPANKLYLCTRHCRSHSFLVSYLQVDR